MLDGLTARLVHRTDARPLALTRIAVAVAALPILAETAAVLVRLGDDVVRLPWAGPALPVSAAAVAIWAATTLSAAFFLGAGLAARPAAAVTSAAFLTALLSDRQVYSNHLLLLVVLTALLAAGEPGGRWSLDSRLRGGRTTPVWPLVLVMTQISTLYVFAGLSKLNPVYLSGQVLRERVVLPLDDRTSMVLALVSAVTEIVLGLALWVPRLRKVAVVVGLALHASIAGLLADPIVLTAFGLLTVSTYPLFLTRPALLVPVESLSPART